jgi:ribosomal-protein-alanine N-acetyltransferase
MTSSFIETLLEGKRGEAEGLLGIKMPEDWPDDEDRGHLKIWLKNIQKAPDAEDWRARALTLRDDPGMIGHAGFHGPPNAEGMAEIGYTIFEPYRRRGYATELVGRLMAFAAEHGVRTIRASVSPGNLPSLGVLGKFGFVQTGVQWDEVDGEELVFERPAADPG